MSLAHLPKRRRAPRSRLRAATMNSAEQHGRDTRRRYRVRSPDDIDRVLARKDLDVLLWPFTGRIQESIVLNVIGIATALEDPQQIRELIAHAFGHYLMHAGNQVFILDHVDPVTAWQYEKQAWAFAYELFMPARLVEYFLKHGCQEDELCDYFHVSEEFCRKRMEAFAAQHAEQIAKARDRAFWDEWPGP